MTSGASLGLLFTHPVHATPIGRMARLMLNLVATITVVILMSLMLFMNGGQVANYQWGMQVYTLIAALLVSLSMHQSSWTYQLLSSRLWNGFRRLRLTSLLWVYPVYLIRQDWLAQLAIPLLVSQFIQLGLWLLVVYGIESLLDRFELGREHLELTKSTSLKQGFQAAWTRSPRKAYGMIGLLLVLLVGWGVSLTSPNKIDELARRVEDARHQAQTTQSEDYQPRLVINNIDGLNRQELLYANGLDVTMMADSVLGDSSEEIMQIIPKSVILTYPDQALYQVTPQISTVEDRLLKGTVISMFGHQQHFTQQQLLDYLAAFDPKTDHYLLTLEESSVSHRDINQTIRELAQVDGRVKIIDWANYASDHPEWFQDQGPFLTETGQQELVKYIAKEFYRQK